MRAVAGCGSPVGQTKMGNRAPVNCAAADCRETVEPPVRYCPAHINLPANAAKEKDKFRRATDEPWRKWYNTAHWRNLRTIVLARDPICTECHRAASTVADHKIPHKGVWALFVDLLNLRGVCKACHDKKTATFDGGFGNAEKRPDDPVAIGTPGKQFSSSSVGEDAINRALQED